MIDPFPLRIHISDLIVRQESEGGDVVVTKSSANGFSVTLRGRDLQDALSRQREYISSEHYPDVDLAVTLFAQFRKMYYEELKGVSIDSSPNRVYDKDNTPDLLKPGDQVRIFDTSLNIRTDEDSIRTYSIVISLTNIRKYMTQRDWAGTSLEAVATAPWGEIRGTYSVNHMGEIWFSSWEDATKFVNILLFGQGEDYGDETPRVLKRDEKLNINGRSTILLGHPEAFFLEDVETGRCPLAVMGMTEEEVRNTSCRVLGYFKKGRLGRPLCRNIREAQQLALYLREYSATHAEEIASIVAERETAEAPSEESAKNDRWNNLSL